MNHFECSGCGLRARWINARNAKHAATLFKLDVIGSSEGTSGTIIIKDEEGEIVLKENWERPAASS